MNNSSLIAIEYFGQFVITDVTNLVIVVGGLTIITSIVYLLTKNTNNDGEE